MAHIPFPGDTLPTPQSWFRKHVFSERDYVTLFISYVAKRYSSTGEQMPEQIRCVMAGTLLFPQEEFSAPPDVDSGQMVLDVQFGRRFPEHQCSALCTRWEKLSKDKPPFDEGPVAPTVQ